MKKQALLLPIVALTLGCQHPEVEAFRQHPAPVMVNLIMPSGIPNGTEIRQDYAAALRARLATRVMVVPEDVPPPPGSVELEILVRRMEPGRGASDPTPAAVGVATGVTVGLLSAASGGRGNSLIDGLFWGLWAGAHAAQGARHEQRHLGFYPSRVQAQVTLKLGGAPDLRRNPVLFEFDVNGHEVVDSMDPLSRSEGDDPGRVREEEARAFARVVTWKLQEKFGWTTQPTPSFYRPEAKPEARPESRPEPLAAPKSDGTAS